LENTKNMKFIMVYIAEAHADDTWPLGFGVNSAKTIEDRKANCTKLMEKFPQLHEKLDAVLLDNMNDDFNKISGCWPEAYMFADSEGKCIWKTKSGEQNSLAKAVEYAKSQNWV